MKTQSAYYIYIADFCPISNPFGSLGIQQPVRALLLQEEPFRKQDGQQDEHDGAAVEYGVVPRDDQSGEGTDVLAARR